MDEKVLYTLLKSTGLPVAYHSFKSPRKPPYIVYLFSHSSNFGADNAVYQKHNNYQVELYALRKDPAGEKLIEKAFGDNNIYWEKTEAYIESESLFQTLYEI